MSRDETRRRVVVEAVEVIKEREELHHGKLEKGVVVGPDGSVQLNVSAALLLQKFDSRIPRGDGVCFERAGAFHCPGLESRGGGVSSMPGNGVRDSPMPYSTACFVLFFVVFLCRAG